MFVRCSNSSSDILAAVHKTHADNNRCHSEGDCHRSTTKLWNSDMSTSSNHTKAFVQCCHGRHTVASSRTLLCLDYIKNDGKTNADLRIDVFWYATSRNLVYMYQNKEDRNLKKSSQWGTKTWHKEFYLRV